MIKLGFGCNASFSSCKMISLTENKKMFDRTFVAPLRRREEDVLLWFLLLQQLNQGYVLHC